MPTTVTLSTATPRVLTPAPAPRRQAPRQADRTGTILIWSCCALLFAFALALLAGAFLASGILGQ